MSPLQHSGWALDCEDGLQAGKELELHSWDPPPGFPIQSCSGLSSGPVERSFGGTLTSDYCLALPDSLTLYMHVSEALGLSRVLLPHRYDS